MKFYFQKFKESQKGFYDSIGLLVVRVMIGASMFFAHGIPKMMKWSEISDKFPDPFGVGSPASLALAIFAEVVCSILIVLGAFTRVAVIPFMVTMVVAAFIVHADDPFSKKELALMYLSSATLLLFTGPGKFSFDGSRS